MLRTIVVPSASICLCAEGVMMQRSAALLGKMGAITGRARRMADGSGSGFLGVRRGVNRVGGGPGLLVVPLLALL